MKHKLLQRVGIFYRHDNRAATLWAKNIEGWIRTHYPKIAISDKKPQALIAIGGDGTILEAARKFERQHPVIVGLNLGNVGFLASVRERREFLSYLKNLLKGEYGVTRRMMLNAHVVRRGRTVYSTNALNEVVVQNPLGILEVEVSPDGYPVQYIRGNGVLVATPTGSTAYNLSAHGPIVMPDIKCLIVTEILDHNIPTPSMIVKYTKDIVLRVVHFRRRGLLTIAKTGEPADALLVADGEVLFPLMPRDEIVVRRSPRLIQFAEFEKGYFFKSLNEKFGFR
ncbi:MAG: NAD(+)/NADH kinase [bacterium]|nr:NAD(+)/NADH kinase [bacterium]